MGISTDAILFYGILIDEDSDLHSKIINFEEHPLGHMRFHGNHLDGCELIRHCSCDYPMFALAVETSKTRAYRGSPQHLMSGALTTRSEWDETLRTFCTKYVVPWAEPGWWMASDWY